MLDKDTARDSYQTRLPITRRAPGMESTRIMLIHSFIHSVFIMYLLGTKHIVMNKIHSFSAFLELDVQGGN